jgi:DNA repair exonuclease SbcCD ATPase subunit
VDNERELLEKDKVIEELESTVTNLKTEKEPLVSELLQVLECYNALSDAIAGGGHGPVCFEAVGVEMTERSATARGAAGASLPERNKYNLSLVENLQAEVLRQRVLARELETHVACLLQERETQEQVLQELSAADMAQTAMASELREQLETVTKARADIKIELEALVRGKEALEDELSALRAKCAKDLEVNA